MAAAAATAPYTPTVPSPRPRRGAGAGGSADDQSQGLTEQTSWVTEAGCASPSRLTVCRAGLCCPAGHAILEVPDGAPEEAGDFHCCHDCGALIRLQRHMLSTTEPYLRCVDCDFDLCTDCAADRLRVIQWSGAVGAASASPPTSPAPVPGSPRRPCSGGAPAVWVSDRDVGGCMTCGGAFWAGRRRHHCRACGWCVCGECSTDRAPIADMGYADPVRVCNRCSGLAGDGAFSASEEAADWVMIDTGAVSDSGSSQDPASEPCGVYRPRLSADNLRRRCIRQ